MFVRYINPMSTKKAAKIAPILLAMLALGLTVTTLAAISTNNNPQNQKTPTTEPTLGPINQPVTSSQLPIDPSTDPTPALTTSPSPSTDPTTNPTATPTPMPSANPSPNPTPTPTPTTPPTIEAAPNLGLYTNSACTNILNSISWGSVAAGTNTTQTIYLKNLGTAPITLNLSVTTWQPTNASNYLSISWDQQGTTLNAGQSTQATITLTASAFVEGVMDFSNHIMVSGIS
jgi:hypothetical protein